MLFCLGIFYDYIMDGKVEKKKSWAIFEDNSSFVRIVINYNEKYRDFDLFQNLH